MNSFTSEPSFLGLVGTALAVIFLHFQERVGWVLAAVVLTVASLSLTALAPLAVIVALAYFRAGRVLMFSIAAFAIYLLFSWLLNMDARVGELLRLAISNPYYLFDDVSFSNRFARTFAPLVESFENRFVPLGFPESEYISSPFNFLSLKGDFEIQRLSSVATVFFYVYGALMFPLLAFFVWNFRARLFVAIALVYFSFTLLSIATPYLYLLFALPLRSSNNNKKQGQRSGYFRDC